MTISDLLAALKARWKLELAILVGIVALAMIWTFITPHSYAATATLLFDERAPDPGVEGTSRPTDMSQVLGTQADIIRSEEVATEVVKAQGLAQNPLAVQRWRNATGGVGTVESWLAQNLLKGVSIEPGKASTVLGIRYVAPDSDYAAQTANAFAQAYLSTQLRMTTDPAKTYTRWFEDRTREVRGKLERAQNALVDFKREKGIISSASLDAEEGRLSALSSQLTSAEASAADAASRTGGDSGNSPDVQTSGVVQGLRSSIAAKTAELSQMRTIYGPNHPEMIAGNAELAALRTKLASETGAASNSLRVASGDAFGRSASLRDLVGAQRARMLELSGDRSKLEVLQRDVDSARTSYDLVMQRLSSMRLQSALPRTNVRQLDTASPPLLPYSPNIPLRLFLSLILGAMVGVSVAAAIEWLRPRVRTGVGLEQTTGVPVLMSLDFGKSRVLPLLEGGAV